MGNRVFIEHNIALIEKLHEFLTDKVKEYQWQGFINNEQLNKIIEYENNNFRRSINEQKSYIWGGLIF